MASAGTLTLSYASRTFTAKVTASPGFSTMSTHLTAPTGADYPMSCASPGNNPSVWTYTFPQPPGQMIPEPIAPGNWIAVSMLQGTGTATGSTTVV
jgi:hypothetical protein